MVNVYMNGNFAGLAADLVDLSHEDDHGTLSKYPSSPSMKQFGSRNFVCTDNEAAPPPPSTHITQPQQESIQPPWSDNDEILIDDTIDDTIDEIDPPPPAYIDGCSQESSSDEKVDKQDGYLGIYSRITSDWWQK